MSEGLLVLISAPSGAGKTSLVAAALEHDPRLVVSISHTTRPRRPQEHEGLNYYFVDDAEFSAMASDNRPGHPWGACSQRR
jgi:guanylate kinase